MVRIEILKSLESEIKKKFNKKEAIEIVDLMYSLEKSPNKGKILGQVGGIVIKELKYKNFRFYFLVDGFKLKLFSEEGLIDLLLRFVRMSNKKYQQETIDEIKSLLIKIGPNAFS